LLWYAAKNHSGCDQIQSKDKNEKPMINKMSPFPKRYTYKGIESWKGFADNLKSEVDKKLFSKMSNDCQKYALAINAKRKPFPTEPMIMALLLAQHKMIGWLAKQIKSYQKWAAGRTSNIHGSGS
jgi:uncharacterized protein (DUF2235 family)